MRFITVLAVVSMAAAQCSVQHDNCCLELGIDCPETCVLGNPCGCNCVQYGLCPCTVRDKSHKCLSWSSPDGTVRYFKQVITCGS